MRQEAKVKLALSRAVEVAMRNYLVEHAGEDLPDDELILENYKFEVSRVSNLEVEIRAKHTVNQVMPYRFTVKVAGS